MATTGTDAAAAGEKAIKIVQGSIDLRPGIRTVSLRGTRGFTLEARALTGREPNNACEFVACAPGSTVQLVAGWAGIDLPGTATLQGRTFTDVLGHVEANRTAVHERIERVKIALRDQAEPRSVFEIVPDVYDEPTTPFNADWRLNETLAYLIHLEATNRAERLAGEVEHWRSILA